MNQSFNPGELSLLDLIDINAWQNIQDNFTLENDVCLRTVDTKGRPVACSSKKPRLCYELLNQSPANNAICGPCLPTFLGGRGVVDKNLSFCCNVGLHTLVAPLQLEGAVWGYILLGPVILVMRKPKEHYRQIVEDINVDLENLWEAAQEIKVMSFQGAQSLLESIRELGETSLKNSSRLKLNRNKLTIE